MVTWFLRHRVADYDAWRKVYDDFGDVQKASGVVEESVYRSVDDPNDVLVMHRFATREALDAMLASEDLKRAMTDAGVQQPLRVEVYEEA